MYAMSSQLQPFPSNYTCNCYRRFHRESRHLHLNFLVKPHQWSDPHWGTNGTIWRPPSHNALTSHKSGCEYTFLLYRLLGAQEIFVSRITTYHLAKEFHTCSHCTVTQLSSSTFQLNQNLNRTHKRTICQIYWTIFWQLRRRLPQGKRPRSPTGLLAWFRSLHAISSLCTSKSRQQITPRFIKFQWRPTLNFPNFMHNTIITLVRKTVSTLLLWQNIASECFNFNSLATVNVLLLISSLPQCINDSHNFYGTSVKLLYLNDIQLDNIYWDARLPLAFLFSPCLPLPNTNRKHFGKARNCTKGSSPITFQVLYFTSFITKTVTCRQLISINFCQNFPAQNSACSHRNCSCLAWNSVSISPPAFYSMPAQPISGTRSQDHGKNVHTLDRLKRIDASTSSQHYIYVIYMMKFCSKQQSLIMFLSTRTVFSFHFSRASLTRICFFEGFLNCLSSLIYISYVFKLQTVRVH